MSLIEQAAQRLEQLRRAGIVVPEIAAAASPPSATVPARTPPTAGSARTSQRVTLDFERLAAAGIVTPNAPRSLIADQFRVIKRPLLTSAKKVGEGAIHHGNLIMVTSALTAEGKSFTSVNLAMSIAMELDNKVLLVDADVARPSVLNMLGLPPAPGLLDVLEGQAEMPGVLLKTNIDKLTILPSGTPHPRATELLASDAMAVLLADMSGRYTDRVIVFDSPPLLLTTEARVLATQMGQVVMVVRADKTLQADVEHALSTIKACAHVNLMLNRARVDSTGSYRGGYGYGYGYGYGSPSGKPTS